MICQNISKINKNFKKSIEIEYEIGNKNWDTNEDFYICCQAKVAEKSIIIYLYL